MDLISILIWLLTTFFMTFFLGTSTSAPPEPFPPQATEGTFRSPTNITNVEVIVMESFPMQVSLHITGEHPDGCDFPAMVEQAREDNTVKLEIYREVPLTVMCPMVLLPYDETIKLDGTFEPGDYVFQVNDFVVQQTL